MARFSVRSLACFYVDLVLCGGIGVVGRLQREWIYSRLAKEWDRRKKISSLKKTYWNFNPLS